MAKFPLILAPLATLSHAAFRLLVHELGGCDLYCNEMISARAYLGRASQESYYIKTDPDPTRLVHQIVGSTADEIVACAEGLAAFGVYGIDVNMGCSAPQIVRKGGGIDWMRRPAESAALIRALRLRLPDVRLSVKLRLGDSDDIATLVSFARGLEDAGLDWLTLHPKRRKDGPDRPANWARIGELVAALAIPVVGNGNVVDIESFRRRVDQASPAGVMIGRGAARKPWIFAELVQAMSDGREDPRGTTVDAGRSETAAVGTPATLRAVDLRFRALLQEHQPEVFWATRARRFYYYYASNMQFGYRLGAQIQNFKSYDDMTAQMDRYYEDHPDEAEHVVATFLPATADSRELPDLRPSREALPLRTP